MAKDPKYQPRSDSLIYYQHGGTRYHYANKEYPERIVPVDEAISEEPPLDPATDFWGRDFEDED